MNNSNIMFEQPVECHFILSNKKSKIPYEQFPDFSLLKEMSLGEINLFFKKLSKKGIQKLFITGSEPVLRKNFARIISVASKNGLKTDFRTNGLLVSKKLLKKVKGKVNAIIFDLFGTKKETDELLGQGALQKILQNMDSCVSNGIKCAVNINVTKKNFAKIEEILNELPSGLAVIILSYFLSYKKRFLGLQLPQQEFSALYDRIEKQFKAGGIRITSASNLLFNKNAKDSVAKVCSAGKFKICVLPDGSCVPCEFINFNKSLIVGNILRSSISSIWRNKTMRKFRAFSQNRVLGKCKECAFFDFCPSCRAIAINIYGGLSKSINFCQF